MAEARQTDDPVARLEAFLEDVRLARHALGGSQAALDHRADALTSEVSSAQARLQTITHAMAATLETFATLHLDTQGALTALAHAAGVVVERRLADASEALADARGRFATGQTATRDQLETADAEWEHEFTESQASIDALLAQSADLAAESERTFSELDTRVAATDERLRSTVNEVAGVVDASADYLAQGLEPYLATAFVAYNDHLEREATPFVQDAFADVSRGITRAFDDYDGVVESASQALVQTTEPLFDESSRGVLRERDRAQQALERTQQDGLHPLATESDESLRAVNRGHEIVQNLPQLLPQLATARDVADRVQELMDTFNPFG
jgi:predicted  nucleic acid-binding Zn-ribbon protein